MKKGKPKTAHLMVRLTPWELQLAARVARLERRSMSDLVRSLIKERDRARRAAGLPSVAHDPKEIGAHIDLDTIDRDLGLRRVPEAIASIIAGDELDQVEDDDPVPAPEA